MSKRVAIKIKNLEAKVSAAVRSRDCTRQVFEDSQELLINTLKLYQQLKIDYYLLKSEMDNKQSRR